jgi:hypothetical protein
VWSKQLETQQKAGHFIFATNFMIETNKLTGTAP